MTDAPLPWASTDALEAPPSLRVGQKIEVLWQLIDDDEEENAEATNTTTGAEAEAPPQEKKDPRRVWWGATIESFEGGGRAKGTNDSSTPPPRPPPPRATIRYEAAHGFESETAVVEFSSALEEERTLRNVGADGRIVADEQALEWRFLGEIDEQVDEEDEEDEDVDVEMEGAAVAGSQEVTASDLERVLSAQICSLESVVGVSATAAGSAALLARAGGSVAAANEVASRFESFAGALREKLAAAARANGGAALGEEEVRAAVAAARQGSGGGNGSGR